MTEAAQTLGLIQGLAEVVKGQQSAFKEQQMAQMEAIQKTNSQLSSLTETVESLSKSLPQVTISTDVNQTLRLPNLTLPEYTGKQNLDRFLTQMDSVLQSSGVPVKFYLTFLKQQCQKDFRAYNALLAAETEHLKELGEDPSKASESQHHQYYCKCVATLKAKRGVPTDQQIRELLGQYYTMKQQPWESVADFSHRFSEVQHELEKLIPGIHRTTDGTELELIHAFSSKLLPHISKEIISRDFKYSSLQELITVAARYEQNILIPSSPDTGHSPPSVLFSQPTVDKQGRKNGFTPSTGSSCGKSLNDGRFNSKGNHSNNNVQLRSSNRSHEICSLYNKFAQSRCQLANNQCFYGRQHKCSECGKMGYKAFKHRPKQTFLKPM